MTTQSTETLSLPAIQIKQGENRHIYIFGIDGKRLPEIATVSRVRRNEKGKVAGYQRPEVLAHVAEIRRYLESENPMLPNALVIAFNDLVTFTPLPVETNGASDYAVVGTLNIPIDPTVPEEDKPGWIVDGQQRTAAIREADLTSFPVSAVGFITKNVEEQRAQFILVNETKPLPRPLIDELLPSMTGTLPKRLALRVLPTRLIERLNNDEGSPLKGMIKTQTMPDGVIAANSMVQGLRSSITDGALYQYRDPETGYGDIDKLLVLIKPFLAAVKETFPEDWGQTTRKSRLMHGSGIRSLTSLMDEIVWANLLTEKGPEAVFKEGLEVVRPACHWSSGSWEFENGDHRKWNDIQNLGRDREMVTRHLLAEYRSHIQR